MPKGKKRPRRIPVASSYYKLSEVVQKIDDGQYLINADVVRDAQNDFGWQLSDIVAAYKKLQPKHFYKTDASKFKPGILIDV